MRLVYVTTAGQLADYLEQQIAVVPTILMGLAWLSLMLLFFFIFWPVGVGTRLFGLDAESNYAIGTMLVGWWSLLIMAVILVSL